MSDTYGFIDAEYTDHRAHPGRAPLIARMREWLGVSKSGFYDWRSQQTADALKFDIRWKVACGRSLTQVSAGPSTLVYWRKRIAASSRPDRVFDAVAEVIAATGILRGRRKRCADSTVFDDAVATRDMVTQLVRRSARWPGWCRAAPTRRTA